MGRYTNILDGADVSEIRENEAGFNYFGFVRGDGSWVIMRETTATQTFRYAVGKSDFETAFTNRATQSYKLRDSYEYI
jgi:hypothetical protein